MKSPRILITAVGTDTGPNVIGALRSSDRFKPYIVGVDNDPLAAGLYLSDARYQIQSLSDTDAFDRLLEVAKKEKVDVIIPLLSKEIPLFSERKTTLENAGFRVAVPTLEMVDLCSHKSRFVERLHQLGIAAPKLYTHAQLKDQHFPVFVKPIHGSSGRGASKVDDWDDLLYLSKRSGDLVIQQLLVGPEFTVDALCDINANLVAFVARERLHVKDGKAVKSRTIKDDNLTNSVKTLLKHIKIIGPLNIQCIKHNGQYHFFEINTRFAAGGLPLSVKAGVNLPELLVLMLLGEKIDVDNQVYKDGLYMSRYLTEVFHTEEDHK